MTVFNTIMTYFGGIVLVLIFLYGLKEYLFTLLGGFLAFCVYYFKFGAEDFEWTLSSLLPILSDAAVIFGISYAIGVIIYKIFPLKITAATAKA